MPTRCSAYLTLPLYLREVSALAGGKRGGADLAPPTCQLGAAYSARAALSVAIAAATSSMIAPAGWRCEASRGKSPKQMYHMCHFLHKVTPPRVVMATSRHIPRVFFSLRMWSRWMGQGLGVTSLLRSFWRRPFGTITPPPLPPLPPPLTPARPFPPMVQGAGGGSAAADASAARLPAQTVRRSWRDLGSKRPVYWNETGVHAPGSPSAAAVDAKMQAFKCADMIYNMS